jgi:hypothetical protein
VASAAWSSFECSVRPWSSRIELLYWGVGSGSPFSLFASRRLFRFGPSFATSKVEASIVGKMRTTNFVVAPFSDLAAEKCLQFYVRK